MIEPQLYSLKDFLINGILGLMMLGIGLSLTPASFKNVFVFPRPLIIGLTSQIIILPLIAFLISYFFDLPPEFKIGLIILASCPGGTTSGIITYLFKGNVALSITFTCINSVLALVTIPFIVNLCLMFYLGRSTVIHLSWAQSVIQIFSVTIVPALIGVIIRKFFPDFSAKAQRPIKLMLIVALAVVFIILFFAKEDQGGTGIRTIEVLTILPSALLLNLLCLGWGFALGLIAKLGIKNSYTISIEASVHNTILAFLVAGTLLKSEDMEKPALVYAMFSFWTAIIYSLIISRLIQKGAFLKFKSKFDRISESD